MITTGIPLFKGKNVQNGRLIFDFDFYIPEHVSNNLHRSQILKKCLLTPYVGTIGNIAIFDGGFKAHLGSNVGKIELLNGDKEYVIEEYVLYYLRSQIGFQQLTKYKKATAQDSISIDAIRNVIIPLPPLAEQKRIVEKIEAIFKQADIIEENRLALKTAVRHTKRRVLDLAVRGKLTEQRPEEGSAKELLERIQEEKQRLIAEGKLKKEKPLPKITEEEIPFDIPAGWKWVTGKDIFYPMSSCKPQGESFRYIDIESIDNKKHKIKDARTVLSAHAPSRASRFIGEGNVLFSLVRPYLQNIAYVDKEFSDCIASTGFFVCKAKPIIYPKYMYFLMLSKYVIDGLNSFMKGDNSPSINCDNISGFLFPLPPLAEQKRIVEKIEQIFGTLDTIEKAVE